MQTTWIVAFVGVILVEPWGQVRDANTATGTASLSGTVVTAEIPAAPVPNAVVNLVDNDGAAPAATTKTDARGAFSFDRLAPGHYDVSATKPAYLKSAYGALLPGRSGIPVAVASGQRVAGVAIRLWHGAVIAGTIRDAGGRAADGVTVSAIARRVIDGQRVLGTSPAARVTTDDLGGYRLFGLPPGDYLVVASPRLPASVMILQSQAAGRSGAPATPGPASNSATAYAPVYYPGTAELSDASTIALAAGEEQDDIDFQLSLQATASIHGTIVAPAGVTADQLQIKAALVASSDPARLADRRPLTVGRDGTFVLSGVPPGHYEFSVLATPTSGAADSATSTWSAASAMDVRGSDVTTSLFLEPASSLAGHIVADVAGAGRLPADGLEVSLTPTDGPAWQRSARMAASDGSFVLTGIAAGSYVLSVQAVGRASGAGWSLASATVNGRDVTDLPLTVGAGEQIRGATIALTNHPSEIRGRVLSNVAGRADDLFLIVFPTDPALWTTWSRRCQQRRPATDGTYRFDGLPAGEYALVALTDVKADEWRDPAFLRQLLPLAQARVSLAAGQSVHQDLRVLGVRQCPDAILTCRSSECASCLSMRTATTEPANRSY